MSWKEKRLRERKRYKRSLQKVKRYRARHNNKKTKTQFRLFAISRFERAFVSQEGTIGFVKPRGIDGLPKHALVLYMPDVLDFDLDYSSASLFFGVLRRALEKRIRIGYIDFRRLKSISPACLTVFSCYADYWKECQPRVSTITESWSEDIVSSFYQIGFFKSLGFDETKIKVPKQGVGVRYMGLRKYAVDSQPNDWGQEVKNIRAEIEQFCRATLNKQAMFASVTEAITNIREHAYNGENQTTLARKWWLSVSIDDEIRIAHIIIFDRGLGIPKTMLTSTKFLGIKKFYYKRNFRWAQRDRLFMAFERSRNSHLYTNVPSVKSGRGNGCNDLLQMVECGNSNEKDVVRQLKVYSQRAKYVYDIKDGLNPGSAYSKKIPLEGTLIEWRIKV